MVISLVYTPLARVGAGAAAQQANTNRPAVRIVRPAATPTPSPTPNSRSNTNRPAVRIGGVPQRREGTAPVASNINRGVIRIGNTNSSTNADANSGTATNANRNAGRRNGIIILGGRGSSPANANAPVPSREGAGGNSGGGAAVREVAGPSRLFSMRVESELAKMGRATPVKRANFAVPQRLAPLPVVTLMNDSRASGVFQCMGGDKRAEQVTVEDAGSYMLVTFQCRQPGAPSAKGAAPDKFSLAFKKAEAGTLFQPRNRGVTGGGMVMSKAGARRPPPGMTRDDFELSTCLSEFGKYKSDPKTNHFRVFFIARAYRCEARQSGLGDVVRAQRVLAAKFAKGGPKPTLAGAPWDLSAKLVRLKEKYDPDYKGKREYVTSYEKTLSLQAGGNDEQELRFLTAAKDAEMKVAVQLATSQPKLPAGAARTCDDWDASEAIVRQRFVTPTFAAPPAGAPVSPTGQGARQSVSVSVPESFIWEGLPEKSNVSAYVRVVPVAPSSKSIIKGATNYRCVGGPSPWVKFDMLNVAAAIQEGIAERAARDAAYKKAKADVLGTDPAAKSPIQVEFLSYLPRTDHYGLPPEATMYQLISQEPVDKNSLNCGTVVKPKERKDCTFTIGAPDADFGWPDGNNWKAGYAFAPADLLDGNKYTKAPEDWDDYLALALDFVAKTYDQIQQVIVDAVTVWVTLGQCAPGDNSGACGWVRGAMRVGLSVAMAAAGLPPHIPSLAQLSDQGAEFIAVTAVDYTISQLPSAGEFADELLKLPKEKFRQELIAGAKEGLKELTGLGKCTFPVGKDKTWQEMGYDGVDIAGCGVVKGNPFSLGTKNLALAGRPAVIYLRVRRNPNGIQLSETQTVNVTDAGGFFEPRAVRVNLADVPPGPEGLVIPVFLTPNFNRYVGKTWKHDPSRVIGVCGPGCTNDAEYDAAWIEDMHEGATLNFSVTSSFRWTDDPKFNGEFGDQGYSPLASAVWRKQSIPLGGQVGNYGFLTLPVPAPGFRYVYNAHNEPLGVFPKYY
jgi:hypothetical protein